MDNCRDDREKALRELMELDFAINDFALYLDTHPCDEQAIQKHKELAKKYNTLKDEYERKYGPLTIYFGSNNWDWIDEPWPWERGARYCIIM